MRGETCGQPEGGDPSGARRPAPNEDEHPFAERKATLAVHGGRGRRDHQGLSRRP